jgi:hypothetical protein
MCRQIAHIVTVMLDLKTHHPQFSMKLEVACLLPKAPVRVPLAAIRGDLGLGHRQPNCDKYPSIRELVSTLRKDDGILLTITRDEGCDTVQVEARSWPVVQAIAENYWETVYSDEPVPVHNAFGFNV